MKHFRSKVINNIKLNSRYYHIFFKVLDSNFIFKAGQYTLVKINGKTYRPYSIASTPKKLPFWEIILDASPGGIGSTYLKNLKKEAVIRTLKPSGTLYFNNDNSNNIITITSGCGIASIKSIIEDVLENKQTSIYLLWGLRNKKDIFLTKEFTKWKKHNPKFSWQISLSHPTKNYVGKKGYVHKHLSGLLKSTNYSNTSLYLCGSKEMINKSHDILKQINFPLEKVYFEKYY